MKDNIILGLWIIYTVSFGLLGIYLDSEADTVEMFGVSCLFAQIILGIYITFIIIFNSLLGNFKFRIKLSARTKSLNEVPKRFKNKVTPIYKLTLWEGTKNWFSIGKYQLEWVDFGARSYRFWLLPFITLFQSYKYVPTDSYNFEMDLDGVTDIDLLWEIEDTKKQRKEDELKTAAQKEKDIVNKLNKIFLENYEH